MNKELEEYLAFSKLPQLYSTPEDIEEFIVKRNLSYPVLQNLLKLRRENKLDLTPTEKKFYFQSLFDYIYSVYKIPKEKTYKEVEKWLDYLEDSVVKKGLDFVLRQSYEGISSWFETHIRASAFFPALPKKEIINYHTDIGLNPDELSYYISKKDDIIEQFWICSDNSSAQPVIVGEEAYMRVHVYPTYVYIFGCDDYSYSLEVVSPEKAKLFAYYLKVFAPVWNFSDTRLIHHDLKFTN